MNDFERLLHGILDGTNNFWDARYIGRACYAPITEDLRIKAEFQSTLAAAQYNALKLTAISNKNGVIDSLTLHFSDYFPEATRLQAFDTKKYIWTDCGKTEWYPCQSFSIAGRRGGFADTRGTLFFEIARIAEAKRTRYLLLENVPGLLSHDEGRTFATILRSLDELGYDVAWQVLNSKDFGIPQSRNRVYIVGYLRDRCAGEILAFDQAIWTAFLDLHHDMLTQSAG